MALITSVTRMASVVKAQVTLAKPVPPPAELPLLVDAGAAVAFATLLVAAAVGHVDDDPQAGIIIYFHDQACRILDDEVAAMFSQAVGRGQVHRDVQRLAGISDSQGHGSRAPCSSE